MLRRVGSSACVVVLFLVALLVAQTSSFAPSRHHGAKSRPCSRLLSSFESSEGQSSAQKKQEQMMERASVAGADKIAKLDLQERTKRAMLAEAVEDRIFELVDELELLVAKSGGLENLSDEIKEEAVEMAKQTKVLQVQYDDLVSGRPSQLLDLEGES
mmetsp:Transcript_58797/g.124857  ORF Transcript_58797/g.124857 Transcript_58797/m.124857 type:complete len:158 (-) Transcript_58797:668-1141(-)